MKSLLVLKCLLVIVLVQGAQAVISAGEIYSLDIVAGDEGKLLAVTIDPESNNATLSELSGPNGNQRFIARTNSDNTFTLFVEAQPWNWVDHIVENTKFVNIKKIPQVLGVIGGSKDVLGQDYAGKNSNAQKWYIVPTGEDPDVGVLTSLLLRQCLTGQGENNTVTLTPCNFSDPNQVMRVNARTSGRYC